MINKDVYDDDDKKIAFVLSFMNEGDAGAWKEELISRALEQADTRGDDLSFGTFKKFKESLIESFKQYDAPGDALDEMRTMRMGDIPIDEHIAKFKILVTNSELEESAAVVNFFRETLPIPLQRQILCCDEPPEKLEDWYKKATRFHNNWKKMQRILGRGQQTKNETKPQSQNQQNPRRFTFPKRERDPNAMDVDRLTVEERNQLMKEGRCFRCRERGHTAREHDKDGNPPNNNKKKWTGKDAAAHIRAIIADMDEEDKKKLGDDLEEAGLGF